MTVERIAFPDYIRKIISRLNEAGYDAYAVGGCIRDSILGRTPHDWDVTTSATPAEVIDAFKIDGFTVLESAGVRHGTVMVKCGGEVCEITTFRCDGDYRDHRRPDSVTFSKTVEEDLARRDFTMNAIAACPDGRGGVKVVDPYGGEDDIKAGIIRTVGDPERRFEEDALRIFRAVRFTAELGFTPHPDTAEAALSLCDTLSFVSAERITAEVWRTLSGEHYSSIQGDLLCVLSSLFPRGITESAFLLSARAKNPTVRLAALLGRCEDADSFFRSMRFPAKTRSDVMRLTEIKSPPSDISALCRLMVSFGDGTGNAVEYICAVFGEDITHAVEDIVMRKVPYKVSMLSIGGGELSAVGVEPKMIGDTLKRLLSDVQEGRVENEKDSLLKYVKDII